MSELIFIILLIISMLTILLMWELFSRKGLYALLIIMSITSYLLSFKIVHFFGLNLNASIIPFITLLETIYIINEVENKKKQSPILFLTIASCLATILIIFLTNLYVPSINDLISNNLKQMLQDNFFTVVSFPFILIITVYIIAKYYPNIKKHSNNKYLTSVFLYITIGLIYSFIFALISYVGKISINEQLFIGVSTYVIGFFISLIYLPLFSFITNKKRVKL